MLNQWYLITIFYVNIIASVIAWPTVKLKIVSYKYHIFEPDFVGLNITEKYGGEHFYFDVKRDNLMLWVNTAIYFEKNNKESGIEFVNKTIDLCKMFSNRRYEPLLGIIYEAIQEQAPSLPKRCPIKKKLFTISFINFETDKMPPIWPYNRSIRFTTKLYTYEKDSLQLLLNVTASVTVQRK